MSNLWRDAIATFLVAVGVVLYGAWALGYALFGITTVGAVALAVLVLGIAASVSAVVPGFDEMMHGSRLYLVATSAVGLVAFAAGVYAVALGGTEALAVLVGTTVILWAVSTARHVGLLQTGPAGGSA